MRAKIVVPVVVAVLAVAGIVVVANLDGLDEAGERTCAEFASSGYPDATDPARRAAIATLIRDRADGSDVEELSTAADGLARAAGGSMEEWLAATRAMDTTCVDAGWVPD